MHTDTQIFSQSLRFTVKIPISNISCLFDNLLTSTLPSVYREFWQALNYAVNTFCSEDKFLFILCVLYLFYSVRGYCHWVVGFTDFVVCGVLLCTGPLLCGYCILWTIALEEICIVLTPWCIHPKFYIVQESLKELHNVKTVVLIHFVKCYLIKWQVSFVCVQPKLDFYKCFWVFQKLC